MAELLNQELKIIKQAVRGNKHWKWLKWVYIALNIVLFTNLFIALYYIHEIDSSFGREAVKLALYLHCIFLVGSMMQLMINVDYKKNALLIKLAEIQK